MEQSFVIKIKLVWYKNREQTILMTEKTQGSALFMQRVRCNSFASRNFAAGNCFQILTTFRGAIQLRSDLQKSCCAKTC
jgi:hypothetical protein